MIIVGDPQNKDLSEKLGAELSTEVIYPEITVFPDTEQRVRVDEDKITGEKVYLVKSIETPVDSSVLQLSFTVDALNRSGADKVIGIIPYIPYMRADHVFRTGEAVPLELVIKMIEDSGLNEIIIVDPHSIKIPEMFRITIHDLSALSIFANKIKEIEPNHDNITIVSPDMGGLRRMQLLDELLGGNTNKVSVNKDRDYQTGAVKVAEYQGKVQGTCFIIDDIISTGKTIAQAVETLSENGAERIYVMATHPVFSENASELLNSPKTEKVYVTDSIPVILEKQFEKLEILSLAPLISSSLNTG